MTEALSIAIFLFALFFLLGTSVWVGGSLLITAILGYVSVHLRPHR